METCVVKPEVAPKPVKPKPPPKPTRLKRNDQEILEQPAPRRLPGPPKPPPKPAHLKRNDPERREQPDPPQPPDALLFFPEAGSELFGSGGCLCLSEHNKEISSGTKFTKSVETAGAAQEDEDATCLISDGSGSSEDQWETSNEKEGFFSGLLQRSNKILRGGTREQAVERLQTHTSDSSDNDDIKLYDGDDGERLSESQTKVRGGIFSGIFKRFPRQTETAESAEEESGGLFSKILKKTPKPSRQQTESLESEPETEPSVIGNDEPSESGTTKVKKRGLAAIFQRSASTEDVFKESKSRKDKKLSSSWDNLIEATALKEEKTGRPAGILKKSPQPAPCANEAEDLLSDTKDLSSSRDGHGNATEEKKVTFIGMFKRTHKSMEPQKSEAMEDLEGGELGGRRTIKKKRRVVSFRIKKITSSQTSDQTPLVEENDEVQTLNPAQMEAYPTENVPSEYEQESDALMEWWSTATGWTEWNDMSDIREQDQEMMVEEAADRVYLAARLFVHLFNQQGASLQRRILELLSLADAADHFHRKTVTAAVGGGVASVAGSVATITGLILAPFTFGASVIVTAVGISVATAGGITSATANITDTVHSSMDRKKVEKMIQGYQEEIRGIRECLEFVQEGMDALQEWDFERYSQSAAKKALNHNIKHVVKEGGRAGKELMINTTTLISTVQLLGATGGAIKAAQVVSVTTGVMAGLFLALDVFFLAKDSHELRKGAKTQFAAKIREVCKELQQGLLELNKVKTQLQKTMDGIEVEEYEEIQEVEVEIEPDLESDPKKLAELEQEIDLLEEKLGRKVEEEQMKIKKETGKPNLKSKEKNEKGRKEVAEEKVESTRKKNVNVKNKGNLKEKDEVEGKLKPELHKLPEETERSGKAAKDGCKGQCQEGSKAKKRSKNQKDKCVNELDKEKVTKHRGSNKKAAEEKTVDDEVASRSDGTGKVDRSRELGSDTEREANQRKRQQIRVTVPAWKPLNKETESVATETHNKHEISGSDAEREDHRAAGGESNSRETDTSRELTHMEAGSESKREGGSESKRGGRKREQGRSDLKKESHQSHKRAQTGEGDLPHDQGKRDEERRTRAGNVRRPFEGEGGEEVNKGKRREDGKRWRRDGDHSRRGPGPRLSAALADGLDI